eukprot:gene21423-biopygen8649
MARKHLPRAEHILNPPKSRPPPLGGHPPPAGAGRRWRRPPGAGASCRCGAACTVQPARCSLHGAVCTVQSGQRRSSKEGRGGAVLQKAIPRPRQARTCAAAGT